MSGISPVQNVRDQPGRTVSGSHERTAKNNLVELCQKVGGDLFRAHRGQAVYNWIADHAEEINAANFGSMFGTLQEMALAETFIALGRAYDAEKYGDSYSIKRLCTAMKTAPLINRSVTAHPSAAV